MVEAPLLQYNNKFSTNSPLLLKITAKQWNEINVSMRNEDGAKWWNDCHLRRSHEKYFHWSCLHWHRNLHGALAFLRHSEQMWIYIHRKTVWRKSKSSYRARAKSLKSKFNNYTEACYATVSICNVSYAIRFPIYILIQTNWTIYLCIYHDRNLHQYFNIC